MSERYEVKTCGLCGSGPGRFGIFGGTVYDGDREVPLCHDVRNVPVQTGVLVTCYEAWTTYAQRPGER